MAWHNLYGFFFYVRIPKQTFLAYTNQSWDAEEGFHTWLLQSKVVQMQNKGASEIIVIDEYFQSEVTG